MAVCSFLGVAMGGDLLEAFASRSVLCHRNLNLSVSRKGKLAHTPNEPKPKTSRERNLAKKATFLPTLYHMSEF